MSESTEVEIGGIVNLLEGGKKNNKNNPPRWWINVIKDLERAVIAARSSFETPGVVIGFLEPDETQDSSFRYMIRLSNGKVGAFPKSSFDGKTIPIGAKIKGAIPVAEQLAYEPSLSSFIYEVIRENVKLLPRVWLSRVIKKMLNGESISAKEFFTPFPKWVLLSPSKKKDRRLIDLLYRATEYEGLRGLARFNDLA